MNTVDVAEAEHRLEALLDEVERGERVIITRHGKPVARLVPTSPAFDREKARHAAEGLLEASRNLTLGDDLTIRQLIEEGRM